MTTPALKPCPFCGSAATLEDERLLWVARCTGCGACVLGDHAPEPEQEMPSAYWEPFKQSAVDRWNRRATPPAPEVGEMAELTEKLIAESKPMDTELAAVLTTEARWDLYEVSSTPQPTTPPAPEPVEVAGLSEYEWKDIGDGRAVRVQRCDKCGVCPSNVDDCGRFGDSRCPYFGADAMAAPPAPDPGEVGGFNG
jgi:hypothetical protein